MMSKRDDMFYLQAKVKAVRGWNVQDMSRITGSYVSRQHRDWWRASY